MPKIELIKDSIAIIKGKYKYRQDQFFALSSQATGFLLSANKEEGFLLINGNPKSIQIGEEVKEIENNNVITYNSHFGKIISPIGGIIFPQQPILENHKIGESAIFKNAPSIMERKKVSSPLETGILVIDLLIPIGKGQRELIIGDRKTGKSTIAINTIINQAKSNLKVVYVSIAQKHADLINLYQTLKEHDALKNIIIISAETNNSAEQYLSPYVGMAHAENLAYTGEDVLLIIDDLSKHANIYREISLLSNLPVGREAYPGDMFYTHSRLLERAGNFNETLNNGSITCLPIVETIEGDVANLISSNIISITDGQIFTNYEFLQKGFYPAIDISTSVSRTGSAVQAPAIRKVSKDLMRIYSLYVESKKYMEMSFDLPKELKEVLQQGQILERMFIQKGHLGYSRSTTVLLTYLLNWRWLELMEKHDTFIHFIQNFFEKDFICQRFVRKINKGVAIDENIFKSIIGAAIISYIEFHELTVKIDYPFPALKLSTKETQQYLRQSSLKEDQIGG